MAVPAPGISGNLNVFNSCYSAPIAEFTLACLHGAHKLTRPPRVWRPTRGGAVMSQDLVYTIFKVVGYVVLLLILAGLCYASIIGITYWKGIGV